MFHNQLRRSLLLPLLCLLTGCANIVPPSGGKKDITPPALRSIEPRDSLLNTRIKRIDMHFDEFITVADVSKELQISPSLAVAPTMTGNNRSVTVKIADSLLEPNTTYRITFGNAIRDLHEGNAYTGHSYIFSTGAWFDSLKLSGTVYDAKRGMRDSSAAVRVLLYDSSAAFDIISRKKPAYVTTTDNMGNFRFMGLPHKFFRIYALKESNDNLQYDADDELVGFANNFAVPTDSGAQVTLYIFKEENIDTSLVKAAEATSTENKMQRSGFGGNKTTTTQPESKNFTYAVQVDTTDNRKRTFDIMHPGEIQFSHKIKEVHNERITLTEDSSEIEIPTAFTTSLDTTLKKMLLHVNWKQNTLYTLRLQKGFVKDSTNLDALPSKYIFRTKSDDDYGKIEVHLPSKYSSHNKYLLQVLKDGDSAYLAPIQDTVVRMERLAPGIYSIRVIEDLNGNGKWDPGDMKKQRQPEPVYPYSTTILMKPGWEHQIDFDKEQNKKR